MNANVRATTPTPELALAIRRRLQPALRAKVNPIGEEGIAEVVAEVNATFNTGRPESRRRGGIKLNDPGAYEFEAEDAGMDVRGRWRIVADANFRKKFWALHSGAKNHTISKRGGGYLAYDPLNGASTNIRRMPKSVTWTASGPHSTGKASGIPFYERALRRVMARLR